MKPDNVETEAIFAKHWLQTHADNAHEVMAPAIAMREACTALDKGDMGVRAIKGLLELWREAKLGDITSESISDMHSVVDRMYEMIVKEYEWK
jgi:hypothetical protein